MSGKRLAASVRHIDVTPTRDRFSVGARIALALTLAFAASGHLAFAQSTSAGPALLTQLPRPPGSNGVGTIVLRLTDSTRATSRRIRVRPLAVQVWYPARTGELAEPAAYITNPGLLDSMVQRKYLELDSTEIQGWASLSTNAFVGSPSVNAASSRGFDVMTSRREIQLRLHAAIVSGRWVASGMTCGRQSARGTEARHAHSSQLRLRAQHSPG